MAVRDLIKNREAQRRWRARQLAADAEGLHALQRARSKKSYHKNHSSYLERSYGPGASSHYTNQLKEQEGKCAVCGNAPIRRLDFDHNHKTGKFRGLLCSSCNKLLGALNEDINLIRNFVSYLEKYQ